MRSTPGEVVKSLLFGSGRHGSGRPFSRVVTFHAFGPDAPSRQGSPVSSPPPFFFILTPARINAGAIPSSCRIRGRRKTPGDDGDPTSTKVRFIPRSIPSVTVSSSVSPRQATLVYQAAVSEFYGGRPTMTDSEASALASAIDMADPWEWMEAQCWAFSPRKELRHPRPYQCAGEWARRVWQDYRRACAVTVDWKPENRYDWAATAGRSACRAASRSPSGLATDYATGRVRAELLAAAEILLGYKFGPSAGVDAARREARRLGICRDDLEAMRVGLAAVDRRQERARVGEDRVMGDAGIRRV